MCFVYLSSIRNGNGHCSNQSKETTIYHDWWELKFYIYLDHTKYDIRVWVNLVPVIFVLDDFRTIVDDTATQAHTRIPCVIFDFLVFYISNFRFVVMMTKLHFWIIGDNCYKRLDTLCRCAWMSCWKKERQIKQKKPKSLCFLPVCAHTCVCVYVCDRIS